MILKKALLIFAVLLSFLSVPPAFAAPAREPAYLGFDRNTYPGDAALPVLRKTFSFSSYWLSPPPGESTNTWTRKRALLRSLGFGFAVLYRGPQSKDLPNETRAAEMAADDARKAAATAQSEDFPPRTIIFLDIEEGGRLPAVYHAYLRAWADELQHAGYRAGAYCSGISVTEGGGVTIITADDIRKNLGARTIAYWIYNDACPPAPGCVTQRNPSPPNASGIPYAAIWQFAQSPRRKNFTAHCAATYNPDGNCYAPEDAAHKWFLDVNTATSPDPSGGG